MHISFVSDFIEKFPFVPAGGAVPGSAAQEEAAVAGREKNKNK